MKKSDISFQEKLNELRLDLTHPNSHSIAFVLVEGDSDICLYRKFFNLNRCKVEQIPGGNIKLEECISILSEKSSLIVGIRDSDFIKLTSNGQYPKDNIILTDKHDIEITAIAKNEILNALLFEFTDIQESEHEETLFIIFNTIKPIGLIKLLNEIENLELNFVCGFQDLITFSGTDVHFNLDEFLHRVLINSPNAKITDLNVLRNKVKEIEMLEHDLYQLTNGHDMLNSLAKLLRVKYGNTRLSGKHLESVIRMLFSVDLFKTTEIYFELSKWGSTNNIEILKEA